MVRNLFSYIVYDLNTRRITEFRLKPWADKFFIVRSSLFLDGNKNATSVQGMWRDMPPTGFQVTGRFDVALAVYRTLRQVYKDTIHEFHTLTETKRNAEIKRLYALGYSIPDLAAMYELSNARIHQILHA